MEKPTYLSIHPIGKSDPLDMPVADTDRAVHWYEKSMGFTILSRDPSTRSVTISRDAVRIRLAENGGDPEQTSCYIEVSNVDHARTELAVNSVNVTEIRIDEYGGSKYRVFFAKDDDGLCYCIGSRIEI